MLIIACNISYNCDVLKLTQSEAMTAFDCAGSASPTRLGPLPVAVTHAAVATFVLHGSMYETGKWQSAGVQVAFN